jgi:2'-5' RNA ligase
VPRTFVGMAHSSEGAPLSKPPLLVLRRRVSDIRQVSVEEADKILTYWLIPAEPGRKYFRSLIRDLAERFDAPIFEPHVTIYVTRSNDEDPNGILARVLNDRGTYRLSAFGLDYSDQFTRTLFVQFKPDAELALLSSDFRRASAAQGEYQLNPHLSLIYKKMSPETKVQIANSLSLPFEEIRFDSVKAVLSPAKIKSRADVEAWRVVAEQKLFE